MLFKVPQLVYQVNLSLSTGIYPTSWKIATVVPLHKGEGKSSMGNYRPISLLPVPGKIIEKIVHKVISNHHEAIDLLTKFQAGFRKGYSTTCTSSIVSLTNDIFEGINNQKVTVAVFIDLVKAFSTVNHVILMVKLIKLGITGTLLSWCRSYLSNRPQCTIANNKLSNPELVSCGVPQGSILRLLFFLVNINDLVSSLKLVSVQMYEDDTVLCVSDKDRITAAKTLQAGLNKLSDWCKANKLSLNAKKTKQMIFGTRQQIKKARGINLHTEGKAIQKVPSSKYLGFVLDPTLSFNQQIKNVAHILTHKMFMLTKIRRYLNNKSMLCIYKSTVLQYFDYVDVVVSNASTFLLGKLQSLQERCLRICLNVHDKNNVNDLHNRAGVVKLGDRREMHVNNFMYHKLGKMDTWSKKPENIQTRAKAAPCFIVAKPNNETFKRGLHYFGATEQLTNENEE